MTPVEQLARVPFFQGMPAWFLRHLADAAAEKGLDRSEYIVHQQDEALAVFFLLSGSVQIFLEFDGVDHLLVGRLRDFGALFGWSAFRPPYRYTSSIRCEEPCRLLRVPRQAFSEAFEKDPRFGVVLLRRVASVLANRLEQTRDLLAKTQ